MKTVIREMGWLALVVGLLIGVAACASDLETLVSDVTPSPSTRDSETVTAHITPTIHALPQPPFYGAGTPSLDERIYESDIVVRVSLSSVTDDLLKFKAIEYLKGSGASEISVHASTTGRNTSWDGREAILFLTLPKSQGTTGSSDSSSSQFIFTESQAVKHYSGNLSDGYTIDTRNPAWLPAESASGTTGTSGGSQTFITDTQSPTGALSPVISLTDLRSKIAWQEVKEGVAGYEDCILARLDHEQWFRNWETHYGRAWPLHQFNARVNSGTGKGAVIKASGNYNLNKYWKEWLTGMDAELFSTQVVDNDEKPGNGFSSNITTARPLIGGTYNYMFHRQWPEYMPCNFVSPRHRLALIVTVTAPTGTVHEAFFDPASTSLGVGFRGSQGTLSPASFTHGDVSSSIVGLGWENGKVMLALSPYVSLAGKTLDFIELDGTVGLSLRFDDGVSDGESGTVVWKVDERPWESGDELMIRIR